MISLLNSIYCKMGKTLLCSGLGLLFLPMPPTTPAATEKSNKMHDTLRKFEQVKLRPFENELARQYSSGPNITMHIHQMLEAAYRKFTTWQKNASRHVIK